MRSLHFSTLVISLFFHFLCPCMRAPLVTEFPHSWRLMQRLAPHCTPDISHPVALAVEPSSRPVNQVQSDPGAHESARGQLLCMSDLWALQQEGFLCKCTEHGRTWVRNKSEGCLAAPIFTRFIIGSILWSGETKCSVAKRVRGLETQADNKLKES